VARLRLGCGALGNHPNSPVFPAAALLDAVNDGVTVAAPVVVAVLARSSASVFLTYDLVYFQNLILNSPTFSIRDFSSFSIFFLPFLISYSLRTDF
jgi:hypothetical protein